MAREFSTEYTTEAPITYGTDQEITTDAESAIAKNINWLHANLIPVCVLDVGGFSTGASAAATLYTTLEAGAGYDSGGLHYFASYRIKVPKDFATYRIKIRVQNTHGTAAGSLGAFLDSNSASITAAVPANATNTISMDLAINTSVARETITIGGLNPNPDSGGPLRIFSILVYPVSLSSPLAAGTTPSGFIPMDTVETGANRPLSVHFRNSQIANLRHIYRTRVGGAAVTYSQDHTERAVARWPYRTNAADYVLVARVPLYVPPGFTHLEWAALGYTVSGAGGKIKIATTADPQGKESAAFGTSWTIAGDNTAAWQDNATGGSSTEVAVTDGQWHDVFIYLKSNGSQYTQLAGLSIWLKEF
tara:strand:- start:1650 stop:2735 length:1086 start_codon:yes stop_codon:yes gene_type:complete